MESWYLTDDVRIRFIFSRSQGPCERKMIYQELFDLNLSKRPTAADHASQYRFIPAAMSSARLTATSTSFTL